MAIVRWEPFQNLVAPQRELDRFFREAFSPVFGEGEVSTRTWAPPVDIYENGDSLVLKAELPGINPDDVEIRVSDSTAMVRYMVLPQRPEGTEGFSEEQLAALVTRDTMIGVVKVNVETRSYQ